MKKYRFSEPYKSTGRTAFPQSKNRSGVYLIKEGEKLVYVGYSGKNLYKTLYRHFEAWNHSQQEVITYKDRLKQKRYTVRIVFCTPLQADRLEKALILKHRPRDNENKYSSYQMDFQDKKTLETYETIQVSNEEPF